MNTPLQFRNQPWNTRLKGMGDIAELAFECTHENWVRTGFNRPPFDTRTVGSLMMHMPDYFDGEQWYEIQGCGRDQMIKLKVNKLEDQRQWQGFTEYPVMYWFYDSHNKASTAMSLTAINYLVTQEEFVLQTFPEGHQYWEMPTSTFNWVPLG